MAEINYLDFDLVIERTEGKYRAGVLNSPAGQATVEFSLPFSELELENFSLRMRQARRGVRRIGSPEMEAAKAFGGRLFDAVFAGDVRGCLRSSLDEAARQGAGLRIRLRLSNAPELLDLPWEYLYNQTLNRFLALSVETPLVRYLDLPERIQPLAVRTPLKILVMISSPSDYPPLDVEREWAKLTEALEDLIRRGLVSFERLNKATLAALQRRLRQEDFHIFHFVGHGGFDQQAQDGLLLMETDQGRGRAVSGSDLGTLLHDKRTLRLVILNACEGARASRTDPFAGSAQSLMQQGIPAVIGTQFEIGDEAAITFSHEFYAALADGYPVDAALAEARKAIFAGGNEIEWGTLVLYMRAPDGRIFDMGRIRRGEPEQARRVAVGQAARPERGQEAVPSKLLQIPALPASSVQGRAVTRRIQIPPGIYWSLIAIGTIGLVLWGVMAVVFKSTTGPTPTWPSATRTLSPSVPASSTTPPPTAGIPKGIVPTFTRPPVQGDTRARTADGMVMVYVPAGPFRMGADKSDPLAEADEFPQRSVTLESFWIDRTEVTNAQYNKCVQAGVCRMSSYAGDPKHNAENLPAVGVDWNDATSYCHWVGGVLPSEAQWEKAARGTDGRLYPWGNQPATCEYVVMDEGQGYGCGKGDAAWPVGSKPKGASPYGALDMSGNVWERVDDWYEGYPGTAYQTDLFGKKNKVVRGGSWDSGPRVLRASDRSYYTVSGRSNNVGFRCIVAPTD